MNDAIAVVELATGIEASDVRAVGNAAERLRDEFADAVGSDAATVVGGVNRRTGDVAAGRSLGCSGRVCAEDSVSDALGGNADEVGFTTPTRPRTGQDVPVCERCEATYGRESFPSGTRFRSDQTGTRLRREDED